MKKKTMFKKAVSAYKKVQRKRKRKQFFGKVLAKAWESAPDVIVDLGSDYAVSKVQEWRENRCSTDAADAPKGGAGR